MNLLQSFLSAFSRKESQSRALISLIQMGRPVSTPRNYAAFSDEGYQKNVVVYRCIHEIASAVATIPFLLFKGKGKKRQEIEDHPFLTLLAKPNPLQSGEAFLEAYTAFLMISGNSYLEAAGPGGKRIDELWTMRPDRVTIMPGAFGLPGSFVYKFNQKEKVFPVDPVNGTSQVLHTYLFHPLNDWYGMSPIESALVGVDQHNESGKWNLALLQNGGRPSGALVATVGDKNPGGKLSEDQYTRLKSEIEERYTGSRNAGRPMLIEGGLDWKEMSLTPKEMDWIQGKNTSARDIALAFGVPPMLLAIPGDNTYSNYKEARLAFYEATVLPLRKKLRGELQGFVAPSFGDDLYLDDDLDTVDALAPKRDAIWDRVTKATFLTVNQKLAAVGYEPLNYGDVVLVPTTMTTLENLLAEPNPTATPGAGMDPNNPDEDAEDTSDEGDNDALEEDSPAGNEVEDSGKSARIQSKVFNLHTDEQKARELKAVNRMRAGFQKKFHSQLHAVFKLEGAHVAAAVDGLGQQAAEIAATHAIAGGSKQMESVLRGNLKGIMKAFGDRVTQAMKSDGMPIETKESDIRFQQFYQDWIDEHLKNLVEDLEGTSKEQILKKIRSAFEESQAEGEPVADLADQLQEVYDGWSESRAMNIARTETTGASSAASQGAAKATGIPGLRKEWIDTNDDRTRESHKIESQIVGIEDKFKVGSDELDHPGDPDGSPEEICNCRCTIGFLRPDDGQGDGA